LKKGWKVTVEEYEDDRIQISHDDLEEPIWVPKDYINDYMQKEVASPTEAIFLKAKKLSRNKPSTLPEEDFDLDDLDIANAENFPTEDEEIQMRNEMFAKPESITEQPLEMSDVNTERRLFDQMMVGVDDAFARYLKQHNHSARAVENLTALGIKKPSWEKLEEGKTLNDEIARALCIILGSKFQEMKVHIQGLQDPSHRGKKLHKRKKIKFRQNGSHATVNIFNDGENCYVCAIQQRRNSITYCNSKNPGSRPSEYVIEQIKAAFELDNYGGAFKIESLKCQRQPYDLNDSLLWSIVNCYMILKGCNVATTKLRESHLREDCMKMLLEKRWISLLKKDIPSRGEHERHSIPSQ